MKRTHATATLGLLLLAGFFLLTSDAQALDLGSSIARDAATKAGYSGATNDTTLASTVGYVIQIALSFVGTIFLLLTVYAGFLWMTARGDEGKVDKAIDIVRTATIGLAITVGAYSITAFIVPRIVERTSGPSSGGFGGGSGASGGGITEMVGCCLLEDESGLVKDAQEVREEGQCEGLFPGCPPDSRFYGQWDDCEYIEVPKGQCFVK